MPPAYAAKLWRDAGHGPLLGLLCFVGDVGLTIGPIVLGLVADIAGYRHALIANTSLMVGIILLFWLAATTPVEPASSGDSLG